MTRSICLRLSSVLVMWIAIVLMANDVMSDHDYNHAEKPMATQRQRMLLDPNGNARSLLNELLVFVRAPGRDAYSVQLDSNANVAGLYAETAQASGNHIGSFTLMFHGEPLNDMALMLADSGLSMEVELELVMKRDTEMLFALLGADNLALMYAADQIETEKETMLAMPVKQALDLIQDRQQGGKSGVLRWFNVNEYGRITELGFFGLASDLNWQYMPSQVEECTLYRCPDINSVSQHPLDLTRIACDSLRVLTFDYMGADLNFLGIGNCKKLEKLVVKKCNGIKSFALAPLADCRSFNHLELVDNANQQTYDFSALAPLARNRGTVVLRAYTGFYLLRDIDKRWPATLLKLKEQIHGIGWRYNNEDEDGEQQWHF